MIGGKPGTYIAMLKVANLKSSTNIFPAVLPFQD
jgi:hypothetical protein